jgi:hypothetical protein
VVLIGVDVCDGAHRLDVMKKFRAGEIDFSVEQHSPTFENREAL